MTKKDFFISIIRVFGLYSVVASLFSVLPSNIYWAMMDIDITSILWVVGTIGAILGLFIVLIFKADSIVRLLRLERGFDNDYIEISGLKKTDIIRLGTFLIGGFWVLESFPAFLSHSLFAFKGDIIGAEYSPENKFDWLVSGLNLMIGFWLLTNYDFVAKRFKVRQSAKE